MHQILPEVAHQVGLLPVLWLALLAARGERRGAEWWWVAGAFGVSWLADTVTHVIGHPWLVTAIYPVTQAAMIGAVFQPREEVAFVTMVLLGVALVSLSIEGTTAPQLMLHVAAGIAIVGMTWHTTSPMKPALHVAFGVNLLPWVLFALWPMWGTWSLYQAVRVVSLVLFCGAALRPRVYAGH